LPDEEPPPSAKPCEDRTAHSLSKPRTSSLLLHQVGSSTITPPRMARNLRVVIDDQLNFTVHIAGFALYNIRRIRPFLSELHSSYPSFCSLQTGLVMLSWQALARQS